MKNNELFSSSRARRLSEPVVNICRFGGAIVAACRTPAGPSRVRNGWRALVGRGPDRVIVLSFVFVLAEYEDIQHTLSRMRWKAMLAVASVTL